MLHKLAIITVIYENYTVLTDFIKSLEKQTNKNFRLFIADLSENKKEIKINALPSTLIKDKNLGYSYGINLCLKKASEQNFDLFCIINNDVYFRKDFIDKVLESLTSHSNSIIGGKIYYARGFEYHKDKYDKNQLGKIVWYAGGKIDWKNAFTNHIGVDEVDCDKYNEHKKTEFITGCLMLFDRTIIDKVGFWDEDYFLYYEDADFCMKAKKQKINLYYDPSIVIWHKNAQSTGGSGSKLHQKHQEKNHLKFGLKYAPWKTKVHLLKNWVFDFMKVNILNRSNLIIKK